MKIDIHIEVIRHNGILVLSCLHNGQYHKMRYIGHAVHEAKRRFTQHVTQAHIRALPTIQHKEFTQR